MRVLTPITLLPLAACISLAAAQDLPWAETLTPEMQRTYVQPEQVVNERPGGACRERLRKLFLPLVKGCKSTREAVLAIAGNIGNITGAYYSVDRRQANMNAQEALAEKKISCTGQSILMVSIFRSLAIPARAVLLPTWNHVQGNHTWCEAWFEGGWHMIEFNEKDFNTPWVMEGLGMLDTAHAEQHVYAVVDFAKRQFEDVTARYTALAAAWYREHGLSADNQRLMVNVTPRATAPRQVVLQDAADNIIDTAELPTDKDDVRRFATLKLPRSGSFTLHIGESAYPVHATPAPAQVLRLRHKARRPSATDS